MTQCVSCELCRNCGSSHSVHLRHTIWGLACRAVNAIGLGALLVNSGYCVRDSGYQGSCSRYVNGVQCTYPNGECID